MSDSNDHRIIDRALLLQELYEMGEAAVDEAIDALTSHEVDNAFVVGRLHRAAAFRAANDEIAALTKHSLHVSGAELEAANRANYGVA